MELETKDLRLETFFAWKIKKNVEPHWERFENMACVLELRRSENEKMRR